MSTRPLLKDQLFNPGKLGWLAGRLETAAPGFDRAGFEAEVLSRLGDLELKERIGWIADCLLPRLPEADAAARKAILAALPPPLDPEVGDGEFGDFIFAPLGEAVARRWGGADPETALDLFEELTQRFSMEFAIRPVLQDHPDTVLKRMARWVAHPSPHVRRLVSEGTRPRLPWGVRLDLPAARVLPLLDALHADRARYVTRSVANHLNDLSRDARARVLETLARWRAAGRQDAAELDWMAAHALRGMVRAGDPAALEFLGYRKDAPVRLARLKGGPARLKIGEVLRFEARLEADETVPVLADYRIHFRRKSGGSSPRSFRIGAHTVGPDAPLTLKKTYRLRAGSSTLPLYPGRHRLDLVINGRVLGGFEFDLRG